MLGQKWVLRIVRVLGDRTQRFCELQDALGGANSATLSQRLKLLEDEGLIERRAISSVPPWVEYSLTAKGSDLRGAIAGIDRWAERWAARAVSHPVAEERPAAHGDALNLVRADDRRGRRSRRRPRSAWSSCSTTASRTTTGSASTGSTATDLVLGPWTGPEADRAHAHPDRDRHLRRGGRIAARPRSSPDVERRPALPRLLRQHASEIVVPIFDGGEVVGEIDIDGSDLDAFDETDARFLEEVTALLAPLRPRT